MNGGKGPSLVTKVKDGQEVELPLRWDPRDPPVKDHLAGPFDQVLAAVEADLQDEESPETLATKVLMLVQLGESEERIAESAQRLIELAESEGVNLPEQLAVGRLLLAVCLASSCRRFSEAADAFSDVTAFYSADDDPYIRGLAVWAIEERINALVQLGDLDGVVASWETARTDFSADVRAPVRCRVAAVGRNAATALLKAERKGDAHTIADEVTRLYQSDTEVMTRAQVVGAMMVRYSALPRWRVRSRAPALRDLWHFIGSDPEPEVVQAIRTLHPGSAEWLLRKAHDSHHQAS